MTLSVKCHFVTYRLSEEKTNMKKRTIYSSIVALFSVILLFVVQGTILYAASKNVYYVDDDGGYEFTTIQAAINACVPGDKIYVFAGEYIENLSIDVSITLTGENPATTIIDGSGGYNVILVDNVMVRITGFTIMDSKNNGIRLDGSCESSIIVGNTITGNGKDGIWMHGSDECTIKGNTIDNNGNYGIHMNNSSNDNEIIGNTITGNHLANIFLFGDCDRNLVKGNEISYSVAGQGILMNYLQDDNMIVGNEIIDNYGAGIRMNTGCYNEISRNINSAKKYSKYFS